MREILCFMMFEIFADKIPIKFDFFRRDEKYGYVSIILKNSALEYAGLFRKSEVAFLEAIDGEKNCEKYLRELDMEEHVMTEMIFKFLLTGVISFKPEYEKQEVIIEIFPNNIQYIMDIIKKDHVFINADNNIAFDYTILEIRRKMFNRKEIFMLYLGETNNRLISFIRKPDGFVAEIGVWELQHDELDIRVLEKAVLYYKHEYFPEAAFKVRINYRDYDNINIDWGKQYEIISEYGVGNNKYVLEKVYD